MSNNNDDVNSKFIQTCSNSNNSKLYLDDTYEYIKYLLNNGANPNIELPYYNKTILQVICDKLSYKLSEELISNMERLIMLLLDYGADPNKADTTLAKFTPWHQIYGLSNIELFKKFLDKGADPEYYIIGYRNYPEGTRRGLPLYNLSIKYKNLLELKGRAQKSVCKLVNDKIFYRVGGINLKDLLVY